MAIRPAQRRMQGYVKAIKLLFGWLADEEVIAKSPAARLQKPIGDEAPQGELHRRTSEALFGACDLETPLGFRDYTLMLVLLDTGIRVEELCRLTLDDVHDDYLKIHRQGPQGAGSWLYSHDRQVPLEISSTSIARQKVRQCERSSPISAGRQMSTVGRSRNLCTRSPRLQDRARKWP